MNREFLKSLPAKPDMMILLGTKLLGGRENGENGVSNGFHNFILRVQVFIYREIL